MTGTVLARVGTPGTPMHEQVAHLLAAYGLTLVAVPANTGIPASYWGDCEAGLRGDSVFARADTPVHSVLHETSHVICMSPRRRRRLDTDAGGDDLEECAVCYLSILLSDELPDYGRQSMLADMHAWGYSFRLGSARAWFDADAADALHWLQRHALVTERQRPSFRLRSRAS